MYTASVTNNGDIKPKPGNRVVLVEVPPGLLDDLPLEDQRAIREIVGKSIRLNAYEDDGRAKLQFNDRNGVCHFICVRQEFIRAPRESDQRFEALHRLIKKGDLISLRRELDSGVSPNLLNRFSWTLMMLAAMDGNVSIGELLISRAAEVNATNDFGETALSLAACRGHIPFMRILLAHGATTDCHPHGQELDEWLKIASGLTHSKIASVLEVINTATPDNRDSS